MNILDKTSENNSFDLIDQVETIRISSNKELNEDTRGKLGQFMTSKDTASLMASMFEDMSGDLKLLDAGAGVGSLTTAFINEACSRNKATSIEPHCFEIDKILTTGLQASMGHCEAECKSKKIRFKSSIFNSDFIENAVIDIKKNGSTSKKYNKAILNPPYLKINSKSKERLLLREVGIETGNLYSCFVSLAIMLLQDGGELIAITPRSFCNGPYFKAFREFILKETYLKKIHVYKSRTKAFKEDSVLQENVIFYLVKGHKQGEIIVSSSTSAIDSDYVERKVKAKDVIDYSSEYKFIHIVTSKEEAELAKRITALPNNLSDLGLQVSTGRVVCFRAKENLRNKPSNNTVPLIYSKNLNKGFIEWPILNSKKPNAIEKNDKTKNLLVPSGNYVLTKRFSSKEEKRRIVASVYESKKVFEGAEIGFDNMTNYFHCDGKGIPLNLAKGLSLYLNSSLLDKYFRQFNGHTQVNATDIRSLKYPDKESLINMGKSYSRVIKSQLLIDEVVEQNI